MWREGVCPALPLRNRSLLWQHQIWTWTADRQPPLPEPAPPPTHWTSPFPSAPSASPTAGKYINWLTIKDQAASIREDVDRIVGHPLVNKSIPVHGYLYDVKSGKLGHVYSSKPE